MSTTKTSISWTDRTWNPVRGCSRVSEGCRNCYAETIAARFSDPGQPFHLFADRQKSGSKWTGKVELIESALTEPLKWRKPARIFVNSMSDLFHEALPESEIHRALHYCELASGKGHILQILTKRSSRMQDILGRRYSVPPGKVWFGVSVESRSTLHRIDELRSTPAAVRFLSLEPLLEDLGTLDLTGIDWVIVGGESGPGARPFDIAWARNVIEQCREAGVACFVKQLGAHPIGLRPECDACNYQIQAPRRKHGIDCSGAPVLKDRKGGDIEEFPEDLRIREFPR